MMSTSRSGDLWLGALLAALASTAACQKTDPLFCCLTTETCAAGGSDEIVACTDPDLPFCDDAGAYGLPGTCVADPAGQCDPACTAATPVCEDGTSCGPCETAVDCAPYAGTPVCDAQGDGACVECVTSDDCSTDGEVCRADRSCGPCTDDAQCESEVCDEGAGACVDAANVIYLDPAGTDNPTCDAGAACRTFDHALTLVGGARDTIKARAGSYVEDDAVVIDDSVTISAPGANLSRSTAGPVVDISSGSTSVSIDGLRVHDALGAATGDGVKCADSATVALSRVVIDTSGRYGLQATDCTVTIARSTISGNAGGGLALSSSEFDVTNCMIFANGTGGSTTGGVSVASISGGGMHRLEFNTIVNNNAGGAIGSGVTCALVAVPLAFANNVLFANDTSFDVDGANCTHNYSVIEQGSGGGVGNLSSDPLFVDAGNDDYHLMTLSPAKNAADPEATLDIDFEGDARPQDGARDIGADEVAP